MGNIKEIQRLYCSGLDLAIPLLLSLSPCSDTYKNKVGQCLNDFASTFSGIKNSANIIINNNNNNNNNNNTNYDSINSNNKNKSNNNNNNNNNNRPRPSLCEYDISSFLHSLL